MANISDSIEEFILNVLAENDMIQLSRNDLASYFSVAPSQINYVLTTRFSANKGYVIESKRGGGGFVLVQKLSDPDLFKAVLSDCQCDPRKFNKQTTYEIIQRFLRDGILEPEEAEMWRTVLSDKALIVPPVYQCALRANILRELILAKLKVGGNVNV